MLLVRSKNFFIKSGLYSIQSIPFLSSTATSEEKFHTTTVDPTPVILNNDDDFAHTRRLKGIGRALNTYIARSKDNARMMAKERSDFDIGKRHLANIMGLDYQTMTQEDIDRSIEYLFPSGLTDPKARPVMKRPEEILPKFYKLDFDDEGRPLDSLFFTLKPKFYKLLSEIGEKTKKLVKYQGHEDTSLTNNNLILSGSTWYTKEKLSKVLGDILTDEMYANWIVAFDYLASLPNSYLEEEFIMKYRDVISSGDKKDTVFGVQIPEPYLDSTSNKRCAKVSSKCKSSTAEVIVKDAGTGKYLINGHDYSCFRSLLARECLVAPLIVANVLGKVDIEVTTGGDGGLSAIPRAVRHSVSLCVAALYPNERQKLKLCGLLTLDPRKKERSKVNQPGARAKWIWKRR
uniref:28S ribosomal protein S9, mitochondrial n=1 Tax=Parastrongyloides trichosuri TaxID=131310 RepID=A0A0N4ZVK8_PARTI